MSPNKNDSLLAIRRIRVWYGLLILVAAVFVVRLFYVQIINYGHYRAAALSDQLKQYQIPATRGTIDIHDGDSLVPLVLNQKLFTLYADPVYIKNADQVAAKVTPVIGGDANKYARLMRAKDTRYVILAKKLSADQQAKIAALGFPGLGTQPQDYRIYPQASLASQVLGFVNNDGRGEYGVEQAMNKQLAGTPGQVKAVTDANGVPLAATKGNVETAPVNGDKLVLTLDMGMQAQMEQILQQEYQKTKSQGISAIIMDIHTGKVKAMANYPTFDPTNYQNVSNPSLFQNAAVANPIEPGSTMKVMTTSAALDMGIIKPDTTFYDPAHWIVDGFNITDIEEDGGPRTQSIGSLLNLSLNTGATWLLMQMGGGQINLKAREAWYNYMANHYRLGKLTGIEQGYEAAVPVQTPQDNGAGINLTYADMSFGQAVQVTAIQMAAADSAILNGGTYYQPHLIDQTVKPDGTVSEVPPKVLAHGVVKPNVGQDMVSLMEYVVQQHRDAGFPYLNFSPNYIVGGKTGTAQVAKSGGGYSDTQFNGTYVGFVGGDQPQYLIVVYNIKPDVAGYAGTYGGQPVFADLAHMLIDNSHVTPKKQ